MKRGRGRKILGRKSRFEIMGGWEEYQVAGNFIQPCRKDVGEVWFGEDAGLRKGANIN